MDQAGQVRAGMNSSGEYLDDPCSLSRVHLRRGEPACQGPTAAIFKVRYAKPSCSPTS